MELGAGAGAVDCDPLSVVSGGVGGGPCHSLGLSGSLVRDCAEWEEEMRFRWGTVSSIPGDGKCGLGKDLAGGQLWTQNEKPARVFSLFVL